MRIVFHESRNIRDVNRVTADVYINCARVLLHVSAAQRIQRPVVRLFGTSELVTSFGN